MERERTTIRLPADLKENLQQEAQGKRDLTLRFESDLYGELDVISAQTGLTISALLIVAIWLHVLKLRD